MNGSSSSGMLRIARGFVLVIYTVVMAYVIILTLAFFLRLFGANPAASFVDWIYTATARIMQPFRGIFPTQQVTGRSVFDASLLFAILIYSLLAMLLQAAVVSLADHIARREQRAEEQRWAAVPPQAPGAPAGAYQGGYGADENASSYRYPAGRPGPSGERAP